MRKTGLYDTYIYAYTLSTLRLRYIIGDLQLKSIFNKWNKYFEDCKVTNALKTFNIKIVTCVTLMRYKYNDVCV